MHPNWAEENLQTIRTLMERSALYRRVLAPIMLLAGTAGLAGGVVGWQFELQTNAAFVLLWAIVAVFVLVGALLLTRRQALLKDSEPFWSPPTRRVCQALLPAFLAGLFVAAFVLLFAGRPGEKDYGLQALVVMAWTWFYGCAIHAAGFFMPRSVRWLGWLFVLAGGVVLPVLNMVENHAESYSARLLASHVLMGGIFGGLHLAYGIYLYRTEKKNPAA